MRSSEFSIYLIPQPLTEMRTRNLPGGKGRPARKANNLTAICEPIVYKTWEPRSLATLWASKACYTDSFTLFIYLIWVELFIFIIVRTSDVITMWQLAVGYHLVPLLHLITARLPTCCLLLALYNSHKPWRLQLQCLSKHLKSFSILLGVFPKRRSHTMCMKLYPPEFLLTYKPNVHFLF
jgi:hypothetical protein